MAKLVLIAEKGLQAKRLADALGLKRHGKYFFGLYEGHEVSLWHASGHLVEPIPPTEYNDFSWDEPISHEKIETFTPFRLCPDTPPRGNMPARKPGEMVEQLRQLLVDAELVIGATDPDREGEVIYRSILEYLGYHGQLQRMRLTKGLGNTAVRHAFSARRPAEEFMGEYYAGLGRRYADNASMVLTANYTYYGRRGMLGKHLGTGNTGQESTVSVGRVQTTVVGIVAQRSKERAEFTPQTHYLPLPQFIFAGGIEMLASYQYTVTQDAVEKHIEGITWQEPKVVTELSDEDEDSDEITSEELPTPLFTSKAKVERFCQTILDGKGTITNHANKQSKKSPPKPYSMTQLQAALPHHKPELILATAQRLYEQGFISYPRTEDSELPVEDYAIDKLRSVLEPLSQWPEFNAPAHWALNIHSNQEPDTSAFKPLCYKDTDRPHDGLAPVEVPMPSTLSGVELEIFMVIAKRYIQAHLPPAIYQVIEATIEMPIPGLLDEPISEFIASAKACVYSGWEAAFSSKESENTLTVPNFAESNSVKAVKVDLKEAKTKIPPLYTSASLLNAMRHAARFERDPVKRALLKESKGIGTPATRSSIISKIVLRHYIAYQGSKGKKSTHVDVTPKGIELLRAVPASMRTPSTTARWEDKLRKMQVTKEPEASRSLYEAFVNAQITGSENLVKTINKQLLHKAPKDGVNPHAPISEITKKRLMKRAKSLGITLPRQALAKEIYAREWLKANPPQITPAMIKVIKRIEMELRIPAPAEANIDFGAALNFIKANEGNLSQLPPSPGMQKFAKDLADRTGATLAPEVLNNTNALRHFIDTAKKQVPATTGQINFLKKLALQLNIQLKPEDFATEVITSANIDKLKKLTAKKRKANPRK